MVYAAHCELMCFIWVFIIRNLWPTCYLPWSKARLFTLYLRSGHVHVQYLYTVRACSWCITRTLWSNNSVMVIWTAHETVLGSVVCRCDRWRFIYPNPMSVQVQVNSTMGFDILYNFSRTDRKQGMHAVWQETWYCFAKILQHYTDLDIENMMYMSME